MRVTVSGVNGFVGRHLTRDLVEHGHEVLGVSQGEVSPGVADLLSDYADQDLTHAWPDLSADAVVHLAGLSAVGPSFGDPQGYLHGNSAPVTSLFEGLLARGARPRVVVVSTGAVYAPGVDVSESAATQVSSPYVVSKLLVETQCAYYRRRGFDVTVMRPFNHIGPGQQQGFVLPDLIAGVAGGGEVTAGDLQTRRDYTDVRDVARAYRLAVEAQSIGHPVLNICSGRSVSGLELLDLVAAELGVPTPRVIVDESRLRPDDPPDIRGNSSLTHAVLGWQPVIGLETTVRDAVAEQVPSGLTASR